MEVGNPSLNLYENTGTKGRVIKEMELDIRGEKKSNLEYFYTIFKLNIFFILGIIILFY